MFNGIIYNTGKVHSIKNVDGGKTLCIETRMKFTKKETGLSVCCSGACLTIASININKIKFYLSKETINMTNFLYLKKGTTINLEKPLKFGDHISGHFIQGHVDTTAKVKKIYKDGKFLIINFKTNKRYKNYYVKKGSIAINGVSLTISKIIKYGFQITVVPHTLRLTNLYDLKEEGIVNLEFDILGKYTRMIVK